MAYTTIPKSSANFSTNLYTGTGSNLTINTGHQSDLIWIKQRATVRPNCLFDSVNSSNFAGGNSKYLVSNTTASLTSDNSTQITATSSTGFSIGTDNSDQINGNGDTAVAWSWKANGAGSSNTDGSINTTKTSANTTSGCSIITYTGNATAGATIGHGMGIKPSMIIIKELAGGNDWIVYTQALTANKILYLNSTAGENDNNVFFNDTEPTTSLITLGSIGATNGSGVAMIAYCFSNVKGFSKQGSYLGNGNADGAFVYTGFKPAFIMLKQSSASGRNWEIYDSKRIGYNVANYRLPPNTAGAEETNVNIDILSNGFKARSTDADLNASGATYIFMAFAEAPFVSSTGIPTPAR